MKSLSLKISGIPPSATIEITDKARRMKAEGTDVISLSIGEPDFDTPKHITDACIRALLEGKTHYEASQGLLELREAIADKLKAENSIETSAAEIIVSCGAKDTIYEAMEACVNPGDEVLILDPSWVSYEPAVKIADGNPVHHSLRQSDFQVDDSVLEKINSKTKMIVFNTPSNPTGSVLGMESLRLLKDVCEDNDLIALSDEIYEKLIYDKEHISIASLGDMHERTITVNGFSKAYAMTGWRIGYAAAPLPILKQMTKVQQHTISHPATFAMWGAVEALRGDQSCVEDMRQEFDKRRRYLIGALNDIGYKTAPADGAFYAFVNIDGDDMAVSAKWLDEGHVATTPGTAFNAPGWIRISYAADMNTLKEAVRRIGEL
ncbi:pyridoxal phosphate-dependent aminotransferase [Methanoplanus sp. FWC-SCC4]|uniref:Aminotransferase n=1 Tax=Methanochimaera problematica TaxID=2609417 RepID=A0AA97FDK7_9EURY|nr:pyridoxal phosphate-dependent aminotransferase [Methanoplanus sp. FWC-SCC4]WOF16902.1 pyridoxal phosphate-dependent aminotransferase [Methanoplanus sp. FWC-SCC4]